MVDEGELDRLDQLIAKTAADTAELLTMFRRERDRRRAARQDTAWLDKAVRELEPLAEQSHDLETIAAIRHVIERHRPGPYPPEDLAAFTGADVASVRRALEEMVQAGLAARGDTPPDSADR